MAVPVSNGMKRLLGQTPARLLVFLITAIRCRPDFVGGFHLLLNGLSASLVAQLMHSRSIYFCGGGSLEVLGGGFYADNPLFDLLTVPDPVLERQLIRAVDGMDLVIAMGSRTVDFFRQRGVETRFEVVPGGIDQHQYHHYEERKTFDLIFVGQLIPIKRVDLFLETVKCIASDIPSVTAVVVGTGRLEESLKAMSSQLGIQDRITFAGYQNDVAPWLNRSKVFVLTSDSEGLSLAMMEAMTCGLPCVVSDVGELRDLVKDDATGYLIRERSASTFAECLLRLLKDNHKWEEMATTAQERVGQFALEKMASRWTSILTQSRHHSLHGSVHEQN
jgi:glycosyltransferase involved in cell wall biosynthesis